LNFIERKQQRGVALITSLIFVLLISVLAISTAKQVISQRKISSSHYDQTITFASAESGIEVAEALIQQFAGNKTELLDKDGVVEVGTFNSVVWWQIEKNWTDNAIATDETRGGASYIIEDMDIHNGRQYYRVTSRGAGPGDAQIFLQTIYVTE
jgi:Tfp pilus assembly protein PilX